MKMIPGSPFFHAWSQIEAKISSAESALPAHVSLG